ncbi:MFS transporter [Aneurinibacillus sp. UBA3580]|uniref:MFS transporter n=1 Tax=Aneurinibacillus sp. UBA3580 TaxID=1946041 RepID=UPI00257BBFF0|nr:MFS transporter [Aneurinibacillus sp. UBA3580]
MTVPNKYTESLSRQEVSFGPMKPTNVRWQVFIMLLVLVAINYVDRSALSIALPVITKDLNLDPAITGVILSSFFWGYALMQIPSGWIADRYKPAGVVAGATVLWGIVQLFTGFVNGSKMLIALRFLLGVTEAPVYPAGGKLQSIWLTSKERGRGATLLDSGSPLGTAIGGPIIVGFMAWFGGWRSALIGTGILTIIIGLLTWRVIRGNPSTNPRVNEAERKYLETELNKEYNNAEILSTGAVGIKQYVRSGSFWFMCLGWFAYCTVYYGLMTWGPMYLAKTQHLDIKSIGTSVFIIFGAGFVGELIGGWIADFWRQKGGSHNTVMRTLLSISGVVTGISIFLLGHITSVNMAITLLAIALFFLRWTGLYLTVPAAIAQRQHVGMVAGCMSFLGNISGIITPICIGFIVSITDSYFIALMLFSATGLVLAVASMLINYAKKIGT